MSEIEPEDESDSSPSLGIVLTALAPESLPLSVQTLLRAPRMTKLMAATGAAPLRPSELLLAIYQLSFDSDEAIKAAATSAPVSLPDNVLLPPLAEPLPAQVIHFLAEKLATTRVDAFERIILNRTTADETFVALASRLAERHLEIMFQNETRILRCPAILSALYRNKQARMSSLNRAIELCARNGVRVAGIPGFDDIVRSIRADPVATDPHAADDAFASLMGAAERAAALGKDDEEEVEEKKKSVVIDFGKLKLHEKIRLATLGNAYCRTNLMRDANKIVAMAAIRSPLIQDNEIVRAAANRGVSEDVIRYIANKRELVKMYAVRLNLVTNPKCPVAFSLRFLPLLHPEDIRKLARSRNVPGALNVAAKKLVQTRGLGG